MKSELRQALPETEVLEKTSNDEQGSAPAFARIPRSAGNLMSTRNNMLQAWLEATDCPLKMPKFQVEA